MESCGTVNSEKFASTAARDFAVPVEFFRPDPQTMKIPNLASQLVSA
jgi:hypothetical protein